ncbi:membrane protein [Mycobacterium phage Aziz]|uniref:Membrane protein n=1 Tax=Mycobacterium phage Aziz TaxID=2762281 RepID=A0A7G8LHT7_9CAUD|nr:membrane protein [Mycobacterium phage Aziz]ASR75988.1 hypothetical protein SEA_GENEVAB15_167 [Mycobacterium phage GenevaB15]QNJ56809.1 membrane protein [Mycobacterium phage Aziz]
MRKLLALIVAVALFILVMNIGAYAAVVSPWLAVLVIAAGTVGAVYMFPVLRGN